MQTPTSVESRIVEFLKRHTCLWQKGNWDAPILDPMGEWIEHNAGWNVDFAGSRRVFQLFFGGSDDFLGIPIIYPSRPLDEQPVYHFDAEGLEDAGWQCLGNLRQFLFEKLDRRPEAEAKQ